MRPRAGEVKLCPKPLLGAYVCTHCRARGGRRTTCCGAWRRTRVWALSDSVTHEERKHGNTHTTHGPLLGPHPHAHKRPRPRPHSLLGCAAEEIESATYKCSCRGANDLCDRVLDRALGSSILFRRASHDSRKPVRPNAGGHPGSTARASSVTLARAVRTLRPAPMTRPKRVQSEE